MLWVSFQSTFKSKHIDSYTTYVVSCPRNQKLPAAPFLQPAHVSLTADLDGSTAATLVRLSADLDGSIVVTLTAAPGPSSPGGP